jgi:hypothetical protein
MSGDGHVRGRIHRVDVINELTQPAVRPPIELHHQPRLVGKLDRFLGSAGFFDVAALDDVRVVARSSASVPGGTGLFMNDQLVADVAIE